MIKLNFIWLWINVRKFDRINIINWAIILLLNLLLISFKLFYLLSWNYSYKIVNILDVKELMNIKFFIKFFIKIYGKLIFFYCLKFNIIIFYY
jgi:hypothetical protein